MKNTILSCRQNCSRLSLAYNCGTAIIIFLFLLNTFTGFSSETAKKSDQGYTYVIEVEEQYRSKDVLSAVTDELFNVTNRYITLTGFKFSSVNLYTNAYLEAVFAAHGVPSITVTTTKELMSVAAEIEKAGGTNCEQAQLLCSNTSQAGNSSGLGVQELASANKGCLSIEHQASWYYLNVMVGGILTLTVDPSDNNDDYDFAVWGPFTSATAGANCPPISAPTRCSYSANKDQTGLSLLNFLDCLLGFIGDCDADTEGPGGNSWCQPLIVSTGQVYVLLVDNYSISSNPYNMSFSGTALLGCLPVVLPVELSDFKGVKLTGTSNVLQWTTESENGTDHFTVEWTADPLNAEWSPVGELKASGNSMVPSNYSLLHADASPLEMNYYRLRQVDMNGGVFIHSDRIIAIDNSGMAKQLVRIVNLLGQEVDTTTKGLVIYQFGDGTSQKIMQ